MSSTNKTTNYNLSQFIGSDKPAWLADYNQDMSKIDAGMNTAQETATGADGKADANTTSIGTLANLTTDAKTSLVAAINEVDAHADTAQASADNVGVLANTNATKITEIENYFKFTQFGNSTATATGASILASEVKYASNANGTLGKIYGRIVLETTATSPTLVLTSGLHPDTNINIDGVCMLFNVTDNVQTILPMSVAANGTITINLSDIPPSKRIRLLFPACLLFLQNFGD
jgi:hypothetical protein